MIYNDSEAGQLKELMITVNNNKLSVEDACRFIFDMQLIIIRQLDDEITRMKQ